MTELPVVVEASFGGYGNTTAIQFDDPIRGLFDTGVFGAVSYTDISAYVLEVTTDRGKQRALDSYRPGTATIRLDNSDGRFDPTNLSGPYVSGGVTQILPQCPIRVRVDGYTNALFTGLADSWTITYDLAGNSICELHATDGMKVLAQYTPTAAGSTVGAGETSGTRIGRLLNAAAWPTIDRDLDTGATTCPATDQSLNVLTEIQQVERTELGSFFITGDGIARFVSRTSKIQKAFTADVGTWLGGVQYSLTDDGSGGLDYEALDMAYDDTLVVNNVGATRVGGSTAQTAASSTSIGKYLTRTLIETDLWVEDDASAQAWAEQVVVFNAEAELRIESVKFNPEARNTADTTVTFPFWTPRAAVLDTELTDVWALLRTPPSGDLIERYVFIEGIGHHITKSTWNVTFSTVWADRYSQAIVFDTTSVQYGNGFDDSTFVFTY